MENSKMNIELLQITVRELFEGYRDEGGNGGVYGYNNRLDIRPPFQREFVYNEKQQQAVINSIIEGYPLNVMYWSKTADGNFELLDGQQRTLSICRFLDGKFSFDMEFFENKPADIQERILSYKLMIYVCEGTDSQKLKWFETINIAGLKLTDQELLNAIFAGPFVQDAKAKLSRPNQGGAAKGKDYIIGEVDRQAFMETAIKWAAFPHGWDVKEYMNRHAKDPNANDLWLYYNRVIDWIEVTFPNTEKSLLKGQPWGELYNRFKDINFDSSKLQEYIDILVEDDDVTSKKGIPCYALAKLSGKLSPKDEAGLNIREFTTSQKKKMYSLQKGICPVCVKQGCEKTHFEFREMEADHIKPWSLGGKTEIENGQMLCKYHNNEKKARW